MKPFLIDGPLGYSQVFIIIQNSSLNILMYVSWAIWTIITKWWNYQVRDFHGYYRTAPQKVVSQLTLPPTVHGTLLPYQGCGWKCSNRLAMIWLGSGLVGVCLFIHCSSNFSPYKTRFCFYNKHTLIQYLMKN